MKQLILNDIDKAKLKLYSLPKELRYDLMESRIQSNHCPNCDVNLQFKTHKGNGVMYCYKCKFLMQIT